MSQDSVERFLGRLLTDRAFRKKAARSIATACSEQGYLLSGEELLSIRQEDFTRLDTVAEQLDSRIRRFAAGRAADTPATQADRHGMGS